MTLEELQQRAFADLEAKRPGALLDWSIHRARAEGEAAAAERRLRDLEQRRRDCLDARMRTYPPTADQQELIKELDPGEPMVAVARQEMADAVTMVSATGAVLELLQKRVTVTPLRAVGHEPKAAAK